MMIKVKKIASWHIFCLVISAQNCLSASVEPSSIKCHGGPAEQMRNIVQSTKLPTVLCAMICEYDSLRWKSRTTRKKYGNISCITTSEIGGTDYEIFSTNAGYRIFYNPMNEQKIVLQPDGHGEILDIFYYNDMLVTHAKGGDIEVLQLNMLKNIELIQRWQAHPVLFSRSMGLSPDGSRLICYGHNSREINSCLLPEATIADKLRLPMQEIYVQWKPRSSLVGISDRNADSLYIIDYAGSTPKSFHRAMHAYWFAFMDTDDDSTCVIHNNNDNDLVITQLDLRFKSDKAMDKMIKKFSPLPSPRVPIAYIVCKNHFVLVRSQFFLQFAPGRELPSTDSLFSVKTGELIATLHQASDCSLMNTADTIEVAKAIHMSSENIYLLNQESNDEEPNDETTRCDVIPFKVIPLDTHTTDHSKAILIDNPT